MTKRRRWAALLLVTAPLAVGAIGATASCSSSTTHVGLAAGCSINSDCDSPLVCVFGLCHEACAESRDCPSGERCVVSGKDRVCELPTESSCLASPTACPTGLVCATDHQCRTSCAAATQATDCAGGQTCSGGACYEPSELAALGQPEAGADAGGEPDACTVTSPKAPLGYLPSNFDPTALAFDGGTVDWTKVPDVAITANCTQIGANTCFPVAPVTVKLKDGTSADLFAVGSFTVASNVTLALFGPNVAIIAAARDVDIQGTISVAANGGNPGAGGYPNVANNEGPGAGGNGFAGSFPTSAAGGGSFCGAGGNGSGTGTIARGGSVYGTPELVPLVAGSAGGYYSSGAYSGFSGGALQISTGGSITIRNVGTINAGAVGNYGGAGSGGAVLLEGATIHIQGIIAANGGAGGTDNYKGADALPSDTAAAGADGGGQGPGGAGSGGDQINGGNGTFPAGGLIQSYGAGGGGAGRIRFNTACGSATIDGVAIISPHLTTACATQGKVAPSP